MRRRIFAVLARPALASATAIWRKSKASHDAFEANSHPFRKEREKDGPHSI
jgi:hypothetical protein